MGGGINTLGAGLVEACHHGTNSSDDMSCHQQDRDKKGSGRLDLDHQQVIVYKRISYLVEETKVKSGDFRFHSSNVMQEIGGMFEHLSTAAVDDNHRWELLVFH